MDTLNGMLTRLAEVNGELQKLEAEKKRLSRQVALEAAPETLEAACNKTCSCEGMRFYVATREVFTVDCDVLMAQGFGNLTKTKLVFDSVAYHQLDPAQKASAVAFVECRLSSPGITFMRQQRTLFTQGRCRRR